MKKPVSWLLFAEGLLAAFTTLVHLFARTPEIQGPLLGSAGLLILPQWILLTPVGVLGLLGDRGRLAPENHR